MIPENLVEERARLERALRRSPEPPGSPRVERHILVAATPLHPPEEGKCWAFHLINDTTEPIESVILESVDYEWGDMGSSVSPKTQSGPIAPGVCLETWRDEDTEVRTSLRPEGSKYYGRAEDHGRVSEALPRGEALSDSDAGT